LIDTTRYAPRALAVLLAVIVAGCAGGTSDGPTVAAPESFRSKVIEIRSDAAQAGASDAQLAELDAAIAAEKVTLETATEAANRAADCMSAAGIPAEVRIDTAASGYRTPLYVATLPPEMDEDTAMALVDGCDRREQYFVSLAYQTQPTAKDAESALVEERTPNLIECLQDHGREVRADATQDELVRLALAYLEEQFDSGVAPELVIDCLAIAGIDAA